MRYRILKTLLACAVPLLLLTGCLQGGEAVPQEESQLIQSDEVLQSSTGNRLILPEQFSLPYAPDLTLDPITCADGMQQVVSSLICESLFRLGPDLEPDPCLCSGYTYDPDTFTYTLELRERIIFSDGSPLTIEDVKATLNRARTSARYGSRFTQVSAISADSKTVSITLTGPNTGFPALLDIPVVKAGTEHAPIGTGPYLLSQEQSAPCLVANQSWWKGTRQPTDRIPLVEASDQETMLYRFTSHDVQLITADLIGTDPISATGSIAYQDADTTILQYIGINTTREPLDSAAFRAALNQGLPRSNMVSALLSGHGRASSLPVSPASPLFPEDYTAHYSASAFAEALAASGYTAERSLSLLVNQENNFKLSVAAEIASTFSEAGVPVTVRALPWDSYVAALAAGEFDFYYGEVKLTADWDLAPLLSTGGSLNFGGWSDPLTDQLIANFRSAADRPTAMKRLCDRFLAQAPILPVCFKSSSVLMQSDVLAGLTPTTTEPFYNLTDCTIRLRGK